MDFFTDIGRYVLPLLAFFILLNCTFSMLKGNKKPGVLGLLINSANGDEIQLRGYETSLGRSTSCDVVLGYSTVSRFHAVLSRQRDGWYITDTFSKTGTMVNEETVEDRTHIEDGDILTLGNAVYKFVDTKVHHSSKPVANNQQSKLYQSDERFYTGEIWHNTNNNVNCMLVNEVNGETFILNDLDSCLIGRSEEAHIQIELPAVSRCHVLLSRDGDNWRAEDLDSTCGTKLNGKILTDVTKLANGDILDVCGIRLVYKFDIL